MKLKTFHTVKNTLRDIIKGSPFEGHVYCVGGCVRDMLLHRPIKDIDLVVDLPNGGINLALWLKEQGHVLGSVVTYPHFGTAMFTLKKVHDVELEAVQTRKEVYRDMESRNPETVFGTILEDSERRDFTYNALYLNLSDDTINDFHNGDRIQDLKDNVMRTCGEPDLIFSDDPLRILRCIRFKVRYHSEITKETYDGLSRNVNRLAIISKERIHDEVIKMLSCDGANDAVDMLFNIGAMRYVFPSLRVPYNPAVYSSKITGIGSVDYRINIAILLRLMRPEEAVADLKYLKFSNEDIKYIEFLLNKRGCIYAALNSYDWYLRDLQLSCGTYERFIDKCKLISVQSNVVQVLPMDDIIAKTDKMVEDGTAMFGYKLPVNGNDIMEVLNIGPCAKIQEILNSLLFYACKHPKATKEEFIDNIKQAYGGLNGNMG